MANPSKDATDKGKSLLHYRYDLPFQKGVETYYMIFIIALMTFLMTFILTVSIAAGTLTKGWISSLQNTVTIHLPAASNDGSMIAQDMLDNQSKEIQNILQSQEYVAKVTIKDREAISSLLSPWLGDNREAASTLPLPRLLTVTLTQEKETDQYLSRMDMLESTVHAVAPQAVIDDHHSWVTDVIRMISTSRQSGIFLILMIVAATTIVVAGTIHSRTLIHKAQLELLHIMGAYDVYIARQFQRHAFIFGFVGGLAGAVFSWIFLFGLSFFFQHHTAQTLPEINLALHDVILIAIMPVLIGMLAALTARLTVIRSLAIMP